MIGNANPARDYARLAVPNCRPTASTPIPQSTYHEWTHNGRRVDRIALEISGGREAGYRAWTHKRNFPAQPAGRWRVRVVTEAGQMIGMLRFQVTN